MYLYYYYFFFFFYCYCIILANNIGVKGAKYIATYLPELDQLAEFDIWNNNITDEGAEELAYVLTYYCQNLRNLTMTRIYYIILYYYIYI